MSVVTLFHTRENHNWTVGTDRTSACVAAADSSLTPEYIKVNNTTTASKKMREFLFQSDFVIHEDTTSNIFPSEALKSGKCKMKVMKGIYPTNGSPQSFKHTFTSGKLHT